MSVAQMRDFLMNHISPAFAARVVKMPDAQVIAIYYRTINKRT